MTAGFLERPDCRLYYEVAGAGPVIVFAHGLGGNHLSWWQQVPHFADRHTCVTFSHRGFAPSTAPASGPDPDAYLADLVALIDHVNAKDVVIVAQSMGGWSALEFAFAQPNRVRALVMASTAGTIAGPDDLYVSRPGWTRRGNEPAAAAAFGKGIHVAAGERMAREQPAMHYLYRALDTLSAGLDKVTLRQRLGATMRRPHETLRTLKVPTLWLTGAEDIVYPPFLSDALAPLMPNARVACVKDAGHSVYFERPAEFNKLVDDFLSANS